MQNIYLPNKLNTHSNKVVPSVLPVYTIAHKARRCWYCQTFCLTFQYQVKKNFKHIYKYQDTKKIKITFIIVNITDIWCLKIEQKQNKGPHQKPIFWKKKTQRNFRRVSAAYWVIQAWLLTPLTFARHRLSPLAALPSSAYFLHLSLIHISEPTRPP